jgi:hypothetical protein
MDSATAATIHVQFLKSMVEQDISIAEKLASTTSHAKAVKRRSITGLKSVATDGTVSKVLLQTIINPATGKPIEVYKIYISTPNCLPYEELGWVHRGNVSRCMVCSAKFSVLSTKHNCFGCGIVVCSSCSGQTAAIEELKDKKRYRICSRCFKGKVSMDIIMFCVNIIELMEIRFYRVQFQL